MARQCGLNVESTSSMPKHKGCTWARLMSLAARLLTAASSQGQGQVGHRHTQRGQRNCRDQTKASP